MTGRHAVIVLSIPTAAVAGKGGTLARHYLEMLAAMVVGMVIIGAAVSLVFAVFGHANPIHHAALRAFFMVTHMTIGMSLGMRYRRHGWSRISEMAGAMFAPYAVLFVPFAAGLVGGEVLLTGGHILMLPAMLAAMLYR